ncbi:MULTISPECIES: DUF2267 domain-containing protein [unclassified Mesorhizobium]|uniref:DUF2267 domain-containing protein n=1 Tax=unclassified Mesorhizobium TaxID=325217 RepID=UPI0004298CAE|nr:MULTISPECIES: DUF2267 domain-containing protein [unclassified Mesorhizobium]WJI42566.1 DUF2267 domain-containing protein [Mesorhizobium sp. C120A]
MSFKLSRSFIMGHNSHTSFADFTHAAQQAQQWVRELAGDLSWSEPSSCRLLRCVLHSVRDWLSQAEMADLSAQLPVLVRGIYFEGWKPSAPACERTKRDFILSVRNSFGYDDEIDFDVAINAVFKLLDRHISHGEIVQVRNSMKKSLRNLWPVN